MGTNVLSRGGTHLGGVLDDERVELVAGVDLGLATARLALHVDVVSADLDDCLGVAALVTLDELLDESLHEVGQDLEAWQVAAGVKGRAWTVATARRQGGGMRRTFWVWAPLTMEVPVSFSKRVWAPSSHPKYLRRYSGGRARALAISVLFTTLVRMPLPRPSTFATSWGILYLRKG